MHTLPRCRPDSVLHTPSEQRVRLTTKEPSPLDPPQKRADQPHGVSQLPESRRKHLPSSPVRPPDPLLPVPFRSQPPQRLLQPLLQEPLRVDQPNHQSPSLPHQLLPDGQEPLVSVEPLPPPQEPPPGRHSHLKQPVNPTTPAPAQPPGPQLPSGPGQHQPPRGLRLPLDLQPHPFLSRHICVPLRTIDRRPTREAKLVQTHPRVRVSRSSLSRPTLQSRRSPGPTPLHWPQTLLYPPHAPTGVAACPTDYSYSIHRTYARRLSAHCISRNPHHRSSSSLDQSVAESTSSQVGSHTSRWLSSALSARPYASHLRLRSSSYGYR